MDGKLGSLKPWTCKNGHVLGMVRRDREKSREGREFWVSRLMLFRQAQSHLQKDIDVIAVIEGTTLDVRCSMPDCGCVRTWWMGEDALERVLQRTNMV
jgi:hypothetical protein